MMAMLISQAHLSEEVGRLFSSLGDPMAEIVTGALVAGEVLGQSSFGLGMLEDVDPEVLVTVGETEVRHGTTVLSGTSLFGPTVVAQAAVIARDSARAQGNGIVAIADLGRVGRLAPYVRWLSSQGLIGVFLNNSFAVVAPAGGNQGVIGTNPVAVAMPRANGAPLVIDTATSAITLATLQSAKETDSPLPPRSVADVDGQVTNDPTRARVILPRGGEFGSVMGLAVEMLVAGVVGIPSSEGRPRGGLLIALSPDDRAPHLGELLADHWRAAGGHLPGEKLAELTKDPSAEVDISRHSLENLDQLLRMR